MPSNETLRGREVVLAGGVGGLGSATASLLLDEGVKLVLSYRSNRERAERWRERATVLPADLASVVDRARLLDASPSLYGLVVFAGNPARVAQPSEMESAMAVSHEINYLGPVLLAREAAVRLRDSSTQG